MNTQLILALFWHLKLIKTLFTYFNHKIKSKPSLNGTISPKHYFLFRALILHCAKLSGGMSKIFLNWVLSFCRKKGIQSLLIYYLWDIKNCAKNLLQDLIQVFRSRQILLYGFMVLSCRLMHRNCNTLRLKLYKSVRCRLFVGENKPDYILVFMQFRKQTIKLRKSTFHCVAEWRNYTLSSSKNRLVLCKRCIWKSSLLE